MIKYLATVGKKKLEGKIRVKSEKRKRKEALDKLRTKLRSEKGQKAKVYLFEGKEKLGMWTIKLEKKAS